VEAAAAAAVPSDAAALKSNDNQGFAIQLHSPLFCRITPPKRGRGLIQTGKSRSSFFSVAVVCIRSLCPSQS